MVVTLPKSVLYARDVLKVDELAVALAYDDVVYLIGRGKLTRAVGADNRSGPI